MITSIIKRDGSIEPFNPEKIVIAISKAGSATGEFDTQVSKELVQSMVLPRINAKKGRAVSVEDVQDIVENVLFDTAFEKTYKAYAIYRNEHTKARERQKVAVDVESSVNEYINQDDWRVRANANQGYSLGGMILNVSGKVTANYWLNSVYPKEIGLAHRNGDFHIHDLDMLSGYCCGHSLRALLNEGFNGVPNKVSSNPPKHLSSALSQAVNFLGTLQNEWAGAQAFSSFDTYLAPFVRVDKLTYPEVRQNIQEFIFNLNVPSRWGCVLPSTKVLTTENKWKGFDELTTKDKVWSINQQGYLCQSAIKVVIKKPYDGLIYELSNDAFNYRQTVTAEHRVYVKNNHLGETINPASYIVKTAQKIAEDEKEVWVPYSIGASGEETWEDWTSVNEALTGAKPHPPINIQINKISCRHYQGDVWCPSVTEGNVIFKDEEGHVFLSGQTQTPFTNLTFDIHCPDDLRNQHPLIGGKEVDFTYGDLQKEMDMINRAYIEVMIEGDAQGRIFTFPIPTYNITDDFDWDSENSKLMFEMTAKYGTPYFQNFMNSDLDPHMIRSMCCRLRLDLTELIHRGNGLFGSAEQTGSIGVVTINLARLGYLFKGNWEGLLERFDYLCDLAKTSLEIKRKLITKLMGEGLYPFTKRYLGSFKNFFSTIGVNGANEMIRNFSDDRYDITDERGHELAVELLEHLNKRIQNYQAETGNLYNSEATPAEGTATRFAREDRKRFPDIIQAGQDGHRYYTNSTQLPAGFTDDPFEALDHQTDLQRLYLGGCVEKGNYVITNKGRMLIEDIAENWKSLKGSLEVVSYNSKTNKSEWKKVTDAMKIDVSKHDKIHITGERGLNIVTSDWHPFFVVNKETYLVEEKRADELKKGDWILQNKEILIPKTSDSELSFDTAYLIGYFMGNGSMSLTEDNRGGNHITKTFIRFDDGNKNILKKIAKILNDKFGTEIQSHSQDRRSKDWKIGTTKTNVGDFFRKYGFKEGVKCYTVGVSETLRQELSNQEVVSGVLSGLIDSDGHINDMGDFEYMTASERLAQDVVEMFNLLGVIAYYKPKLSVRENESVMYRVRVSAFELSKVWDSLKTTTARIVKADYKKYARQLPVARVKEVSKVDVEDNQFYDLTVEDNHNYLCGKQTYVFIHNTVLHLFTGERISSWKAARDIVKKTFSHYQLPYITITPTFSICPKHGYIAGEHKFCPLCDDELVAKKKHEKAKCQKVGIGK
jgi:ribonucleoside-triphosphate reductase